jgi:subtilisin-like proprotein convertase family protein
MKTYLLTGLLAVGTLMTSSAAIYSLGNVNGSGTALNTVIPDGNPNGVSSAITVSTPDSLLTDVSVTLNITGGNNGDLYAYLSYNGTLVTLLNRVGTGSGGPIQSAFGFSTSGFNNVTLSDSGTGGSIHNIASPLPGTSGTDYTPDGGSLASFNGQNPNGTWTLFFADLSAGGTSTLQGWSLDITAVPEPVNAALAVFGGLLLAWQMVRRRQGVGASFN